MAEVISNFDKLMERVPNLSLENKDQRAEALKHYFSKGGVVSISPTGDDSWPMLTYPTKLRLKKQISDLQELKSQYSKKQAKWKQKFFEARTYDLTHNIKKIGKTLYWKHLLKYTTNKDYRKDADTVKLPAHLVADPKWKPMVNMFVNSDDYRKQLTDTVQNSIVYKNDRKVARYAQDLKDFRMEESNKKIEELQKKLETLEKDVATLTELLKWTSK